jgi:glyoxylase-like metal-dependent hydrolase (beta-lactamase superfamily II)
MLKKELSSGIIEYIFEPKHGQHFGNRITALINEDKVVLIDTGYQHQMAEVIKELDTEHLKVEKVIITHFHDDHMEGLKVLPKLCVYGSSTYQNTLDRWTLKEEHHYFTPNVLVEGSHKIQFGRHEVEMIEFPGHSICTMLIRINDEYVHIADELMFSNQGEPILPCITKQEVKSQFESINKLKEYMRYTFILGHGDNIKDKGQIADTIENTSLYLNKILSTSDRISFEEATKECTCAFLHKEWHENVYIE